MLDLIRGNDGQEETRKIDSHTNINTKYQQIQTAPCWIQWEVKMERQEETAESDWLSLLLLLLQPCSRSDNDFFLASKENMGQENLFTLKEGNVCEKNWTKEEDKQLSYEMSVWLKGPEGSYKNYLITFGGPKNSTPSYVIL